MGAASLIALGGGALSALLYVSTLLGSLSALMLVLMAQLPLFLVGLGLGTRSLTLALGLGTLAVGAVAGPWAAGNYLLAEAAPVYLLVCQGSLSRGLPEGRTEWYPAGRLLVWLSLYAGAVLLGFTLYFSSREGGLEGELQRAIGAMWQILGVTPSPEATRLLEAFVAVMPGLGAVSWLVITVANAALAQGVLLRFGRNLRPNPTLESFDLPRWLGLLLAAALAAAVLLAGSAGFAGRNLAFILAVPYFFAGVATLHAVVRRRASGPAAAVLLYIVLVLAVLILSWLAIVAIAAFGVFDQALGLRRRFAPPAAGPKGS